MSDAEVIVLSTPSTSRAHAMAVLCGAETVELKQARRLHEEAVRDFKDPQATALWARVIWRMLANTPRYRWVNEPVGVTAFASLARQPRTPTPSLDRAARASTPPAEGVAMSRTVQTRQTAVQELPRCSVPTVGARTVCGKPTMLGVDVCRGHYIRASVGARKSN